VHGSQPKANAEWWRQKIEGTIRRDDETNEILIRAGWIVVRIWEHTDPNVAAEVVEQVVINARQGDRPAAVLRP
jgi:DNA mismatch endonuclease (patch repair protein)